jgi:hypothetical protein
MFAEKRVGIVLAVLLLICALLFCNANAVVEAKSPTIKVTPAKIPTTLTISAPSSTQVKQSFSITGKLTTNSAALSKSKVSLQRLNGNTWTTLASQTVTGTYSFSWTETTANTYQYRTTYAGSAPYVSATSPTATVTVTPAKISTTLTISAPSSTQVKQSFSITGKLTTNSAALSKSKVSLQRLNGNTWTTLASQTVTEWIASQHVTISTYSFSWTETTANTYQYRTTDAGSAAYVSATSPTATVTVNASPTPTPTQLTLAASTTTPALNQSFTLSGSLTANGTPLSGKTIQLQREDASGHWDYAANTTTTDANGAYVFTRSESVQGHYVFEPTFFGAGAYASAHVAIGITVGTVQQSEMSITTTNSAPAVNQSYTVYGSLHDGVSGAPIAGQPINFFVKAPSGQEVVETWATTDANGAYAFTRSESAQGSYWLQVSFYGNSNYNESSAMMLLTIGNPIPTTIRSLTVTNSNPAVNQPFTFSGYLTDINGTPLADRTIWVNIRLPTGDWNMTAGYPRTDSNGYFSVTYSEQVAGEYDFEFHFTGDNNYAQCDPSLPVVIGTLQPTDLSMNTSVTNPAVNQSFTLSGYLTDANGTPLAGKEILLDRIVAGSFGNFDERYTDQNGYYSFVLRESAGGLYYYMPHFLGDQMYASSYAFMSLTVGTLSPTTVTITASTTTPAVNQSFTLSGTLKAGSTPLSGKSITLARKDPSGNWIDSVDTTTTTANGSYTFTRSESAQGTYLYEVIFYGDTYAATNAAVSVTVGNVA